MTHKTQEYFFPAALTILILAALLILNILTPLVPGDDFLYQNIFPTEGIYGSQKPVIISDFVHSFINHYKNYNYRIFPHIVLQLLLALPWWVFDIANSLIFFLIPFVLLRPFWGHYKHSKTKVWLIVCLTFLVLHPDLSWAYFWTTGSVSYTWFLVPQLYLMGSLYMSFQHNRKFNLVDVCAAILSATANEAVLVCLIACALIVILKDKNKINAITTSIILILIAGGIIMFLSPSFGLRIHNTYNADQAVSFFSLEKILRQAYYLFRILLLGIIFLCFAQKSLRLKNALFFILAIAIFSGVLFIVPIYESRSSVFAYSLGMMMFLASIERYNKVSTLAIVIALSMLGLKLWDRYEKLTLIQQSFERNINKLESAGEGNQQIELDYFCPLPKNHGISCDDIFQDPKHFHNSTLSYSYGHSAVVPSSAYSIPKRQERFENKRKEKPLKDYFRQAIYSEELEKSISIEEVYYLVNSEVNATELILCLNEVVGENNTVIVRGSKRSLYHSILDLLPLWLRINFLDFLEEDVRGRLSEGQWCYNNLIFAFDEYRYFVLSLYSIEKHNAVGEPIIIFPPNVKVQ